MSDEWTPIDISEIRGVAASSDGQAGSIRIIDTSGGKHTLQFNTTFANSLAAAILVSQTMAVQKGAATTIPIPSMGATVDATTAADGLTVTLTVGVAQGAPLTFRLPEQSVSGLAENLRQIQAAHNIPRVS